MSRLASRSLLTLITCATLLCVASATHADTVDPITAEPHALDWPRSLSVRALVGYDHAILTAPSDPAGAPQFMSGTAFTGPGASFGAGARAQLNTYFAVETGLMFAFESMEGFEDAGDWKRTLSLSSTRLNLPFLTHGGWSDERFRASFGLGLLVSIPLSATADLEEDRVPEADRFPLEITAPTELGLPLVLEGAVHIPDSPVWIPLSLRFTWFPGVGQTSVDRFEGYASPEAPGKLRVAPAWTITVLTGVDVDVL